MSIPSWLTPELSALISSMAIAVLDYLIGRAKSTDAKNLLHGAELMVKDVLDPKLPPGGGAA